MLRIVKISGLSLAPIRLRAYHWHIGREPHRTDTSHTHHNMYTSYEDSVMAYANDDGFLSDKIVSQLLADHSTGWAEYCEWLGNRQTPLMAECILAFLGY